MAREARLLVNIDVPDLARAETFYCAALGLTVGRRISPEATELLGLEAPIYLLENRGGSLATDASPARRDYRRHWTPIHFDVAVDDLDAARAAALAAGALEEVGIQPTRYGRIAMFADPFGHGFCLIEFNDAGYDAPA